MGKLSTATLGLVAAGAMVAQVIIPATLDLMAALLIAGAAGLGGYRFGKSR